MPRVPEFNLPRNTEVNNKQSNTNGPYAHNDCKKAFDHLPAQLTLQRDLNVGLRYGRSLVKQRRHASHYSDRREHVHVKVHLLLYGECELQQSPSRVLPDDVSMSAQEALHLLDAQARGHILG